MPYALILKDEARLDMQDAYQYYEKQQPGLGERFLSEVEKRINTICEHPEYYSFIDNRHILRDVVIDHFPFVVIYDFINDKVTVYSVHLTHKRSKLQNS